MSPNNLFPIIQPKMLETLETNIQLNLLERAINASTNGIIITDAQQEDDPIIYVNEAFENMTGYAFNEVAGHNCRFLHGHHCQQEDLSKIRQALQEGKECCAVLKNYRKDGSEFWNELYIAPVHNAQNQITHHIGVQTDVTHRKQAENILQESETQFRQTFECAPIGMALVRIEGRFLDVNPALCEMLGYTKTELMRRTLLEMSHPDDFAEGKFLYRRCLQGEIQTFQLEKRYLTKDGSTIYALTRATLIRDENQIPLHYVVQILDLSCALSQHPVPETTLATKQVTPAKALPNYFHYDGLTGLPTRILFEEYLEEALWHQPQQGAVFFLDLDRFQIINESFGHGAGDQLLIAISDRLEELLQKDDFMARSGGDEFAIFVKDVNTLSQARQIAKTLQEKLTSPFTINTSEGKITTSDHFITTTIGLTLTSGHYSQEKGRNLLQNAEIALGRAKKKGKATVEVFDQTLGEKVWRQSRLETDLKKAISRQELYVQYQPIMNLVTGRLDGFEALVRWQHPELGFVSPGEFIPIAEETGLVIPIGYWVLDQACQQLQEWQQRFPECQDLTISVNLSGLQIKDPGLVQKVKGILEKTGLVGNQLKLELTETALIENVDLASQQLQQLKRLKIQLSIDDFGTGYSSLSYLQQFPVDVLKIDRSFVSAMTPDNHNLKIVQAVISLAHALDLEVIGEGVETGYQKDQLKSLGCEYGQGYYYAKPLGAVQATQVVQEDVGQ
ncbi:diguanylate cyclase/phosphodiesterase with PAS/PAC sensor(s) [Halothece sp. PCC 7418]|uniref:sensor domain-containing protein n=1 Tax=Halothece sp. (strain PCC 7418) TaxID=65093 RepID=UPI0002A085E9|nr:EAL domain-containing protein [Halothece sp. PCC 7418]AFZ44435.1 diguanylate cyclase/phosphodiesterase with PAS/PAC sensor(s) [Halothece sp. PCC 7418]